MRLAHARELELVGALLRGELGNASQTIKNQFRLIYQKLGIPSGGDGRFDMRCALVARLMLKALSGFLPARNRQPNAATACPRRAAKKEADGSAHPHPRAIRSNRESARYTAARRALGMRL